MARLARLLTAIAIGGAWAGCPSDDAPDPAADATADSAADHGAPQPDDSIEPGDDVPPDAVSGPLVFACNPLASELDCMLPFPSDVFRQPDATLPAGYRVVLGEQAVPRDGAGASVDLLERYPFDGFPLHPQIFALLPGGVEATSLVGPTDDPLRSLDPNDSLTLLLDTATGMPVLHFAEVDPEPAEASQRVLAIRPLVRLDEGRRYIVAVRGVGAPDGFRRLRDGEAAGDPELGALAARYQDEVFPQLTAAGLDRDQLRLAWDFTTTSAEGLTGDMRAIRDDVIARLSAQPPLVTVEVVSDDPHEHVGRLLEGSVEVPLYLAAAGPGNLLRRGADGRPVAHGEVAVPFSLLIPPAAFERSVGDPAPRLVQYGHGFFGDRGELLEHPAALAATHSLVLFASDWWGLSSEDMAPWVGDLGQRLGQSMWVADRIHQAMANFLALAYAVQGPLAELPATRVGPAEQPLAWDASQPLAFYGISMGHVLGATYVALSPHIERAVLDVGGCGFGFALWRSKSFEALHFVLSQSMPAGDPVMLHKAFALVAAVFERIDPLAYAPQLLADPWPGSPVERRVLLQVALGDSAMPNLASFLHARVLGTPLLEPAPATVPALPSVAAPHSGSAVALYDFGIDPAPGAQFGVPAEGNEAHYILRDFASTMAQTAHFLKTGVADHFCDGLCDPE